MPGQPDGRLGHEGEAASKDDGKEGGNGGNCAPVKQSTKAVGNQDANTNVYSRDVNEMNTIVFTTLSLKTLDINV